MSVGIITGTENPERIIAMAASVTRDKEIMDYAGIVMKLAKLGHWSVFEHVSVTFRLENISRVTQQQLTRHRMASYSVESQRVVKPKSFLIPKSIEGDDATFEIWYRTVNTVIMAYDELVKHGVPAEDARYLLPQAATGTIIMTMNAREIYHFLGLRISPAAQWEIRQLASEMYERLSEMWPNVFNETILTYAQGGLNADK